VATDIEKLIDEIRALSASQRRRLQQVLAEELDGGCAPLTDEAYQRLLLAAGLVTEVRARRRDQKSFDAFKPVRISGKPLSETIIEERR
jgi:hypothetical protein